MEREGGRRPWWLRVDGVPPSMARRWARWQGPLGERQLWLFRSVLLLGLVTPIALRETAADFVSSVLLIAFALALAPAVPRRQILFLPARARP
ncbi:MAG TPA: hypothetical protein VFJ97_11410 [Dermatophilaceae bacterium]|nr:hypothetical protein [Dermatophilaceae bacterium]